MMLAAIRSGCFASVVAVLAACVGDTGPGGTLEYKRVEVSGIVFYVNKYSKGGTLHAKARNYSSMQASSAEIAAAAPAAIEAATGCSVVKLIQVPGLSSFDALIDC